VRVRDLYWVAGMLEGEGCFTPQRRTSNSGAHAGYLIQVTSVDTDILYRIQAICGGSVGGPYRVRKTTHNPTYQWRLYGAAAKELMESIHHIMGERRQRQIEAALDEVRSKSRRVL
jgi:hypothetical protein